MKYSFSPFQILLMGFGGLVMGTLYKYRVFPWLKDAMTLDHGTWKQTADMDIQPDEQDRPFGHCLHSSAMAGGGHRGNGFRAGCTA